jgi:hypothetical protein
VHGAGLEIGLGTRLCWAEHEVGLVMGLGLAWGWCGLVCAGHGLGCSWNEVVLGCAWGWTWHVGWNGHSAGLDIGMGWAVHGAGLSVGLGWACVWATQGAGLEWAWGLRWSGHGARFGWVAGLTMGPGQACGWGGHEARLVWEWGWAVMGMVLCWAWGCAGLLSWGLGLAMGSAGLWVVICVGMWNRLGRIVGWAVLRSELGWALDWVRAVCWVGLRWALGCSRLWVGFWSEVASVLGFGLGRAPALTGFWAGQRVGWPGLSSLMGWPGL